MINRLTVSPLDVYFLDAHATYSRNRRALLRAANLCICGPLDANPSKRRRVEHGAVVRGGKCARCVQIHAGTRTKGN